VLVGVVCGRSFSIITGAIDYPMPMKLGTTLFGNGNKK